MEHQHSKYPIGHIIGFLLSLAMTILAAIVALRSGLPKPAIMSIIGVLAFMQAGMQLFMFMHIKESDNSVVQIGNIIYSIIIALTIVLGSVWVMHN
ncbi:quinol oxidase subunit 4 [Heyndrickxia shackletonii]|uniref:Quinol oxidase subunit 4 n=1 Tax=Heyndrickxia shackletonii TaxID=157838 RepID=A0A0Q3WRN6_9BACI|nr:cytochrome aa3 quinol oxidase subunit IV [Heyndrickxia shackletonii]KQL50799.1 quinol oxidase subunit 4 [Heyndrickxia shackletonii]MBB2479377.1 cytochrome aa3 quinol oxidase subunit IV [Bacillus sp. APMAM]NEY99759.1 cytochrome aa3 quinol oxidase subunit IV [Heyndrickxia shackletonii]RTZ56176.1 cytochrome aa3 quinol oxidase subunit IV [Bacillus sp. SAJ1]